MASMSHCVIENTCDDMWASVGKFGQHFNNIKDNPYELAHIESLYEAAKEYVRLYEEYLEDKEAFLREHSPEEWAFEVSLQNGEVMYNSKKADDRTYDDYCDASDEAYDWIREYVEDQDCDEDEKFIEGDFRVSVYNVTD